MLRSFAGGEVFGELWGSSPPRVLALHGWRRAHGDFAGVLGPASAQGPSAAAALDLPGFGASPEPPGPWGSADYAATVVRVIEEITGGASGPLVVLGHSFGGKIAVNVAASRPDLVRALVLTGAPVARTGTARRPPAGFRVVRALRRTGLVSESVLDRARKKYGSADYVAAQGVMRQVLVRVLAEDYSEQLSGLRCPVELVWGDDDTEVPLAVAEAVVRTVSRAHLTVCPGAGHLTPLSVPDRLRQAVDKVLDAPCEAGAR
jgi:pimeloyl-ACP methyl ester carboxylesterase